MKKQIAISMILLMGIMLFSLVSADSYTVNGVTKNFPQTSPLAQFFSIIKFSIFDTQFSVVGDSRQCGDNNQANEDFTFGGTTTGTYDIDCSDYGYDNCIIDVAYSNANGQITGWEGEYRDNFGISWTSTGPKYFRAQIYACPHPECYDNNDCVSWNGAGSTCERGSCSSWGRGYRCTWINEVEQGIPYEYSHFHYCTEGSNTLNAKCYYRNAQGTCTERNYPGRSDCPASYDIYPLFNSLSACQGSSYTCSQKNGIICPNSQTCSSGHIISGTLSGNSCCDSTANCVIQLGCNNQGQSCGGPANLQSGQPCCGTLTCQNFQCAPLGTECTFGQTRACSITNGAGTQTCSASNYWAACIANSCNSGYSLCSNTCKTDCGGVTPGTKVIGASCAEDTECASLHCDKSHWYSISSTCQPIPWDEIKRISAYKVDIQTMTTKELLSLACTESANCIAPNNHTSAKCINMKQLQDEGTITVTSASFFDYAKATIALGGTGAVIGVAGGALGFGALCAVGVVGTFLLAPTVVGSAAGIALASTTCAYAAVAGGAIGGAYGLVAGTEQAVISVSGSNEIVKALKAEDISKVGFCVAEEKTSGWFDIFSYLAFFDVNGDGQKNSTDGMIIGGIILALIIIMLLR
jgi:hypothetical protein